MESQTQNYDVLISQLLSNMKSTCHIKEPWVSAKWVDVDSDGDIDYLEFVDSKGQIHYGVGFGIRNSLNLHLGGNHLNQGCTMCEYLGNICRQVILQLKNESSGIVDSKNNYDWILKIQLWVPPEGFNTGRKQLLQHIISEMNNRCELKVKWNSIKWVDVDQDGDTFYTSVFDSQGEEFYGLEPQMTNGLNQHLGGAHKKKGCRLCEYITDFYYFYLKKSLQKDDNHLLVYHQAIDTAPQLDPPIG